MQESEILDILPETIREVMIQTPVDYKQLQEIKLRAGQPFILIAGGKEQILSKKVTKEEVRQTLDYVSNYSLYAFEQEMRQGFITIEGGHRVGMTGQTILEDGHIKNLKYISSINIRISHEILGCSDKIFPYISYNRQLAHTLIISPPGCGKTTLLRDMVRQISNGNEWVKGMTVGVVDERSEIGGSYMGTPQNNLGSRTDLLDCCPKAEGMIMLIRSMGPKVIAVDEIGTEEDVHAIAYAMHCGCKMLATVHGSSLEDLKRKPTLSKLLKGQVFERYIVLENREKVGQIEGVYDENGRRLL